MGGEIPVEEINIPQQYDLIERRAMPVLMAVSRLAGKAIMDFRLIEEGDRIAVAVSGGKDSLSLLHVLRHRQKISPVNFDFTAVHVDFEFSDFDPTGLLAYLDSRGFERRLVRAESLKGQRYEDIDCYTWSRQRRKALFEFANQERYNKIAFGHHMDDIAETIVLNQFFRGEVSGMKPRQEIFDGKVVIIRPLALVREKQMEKLARHLQIDAMGQSKCAYDDASRRIQVKKALREFEKINPAVVKNIFHSLTNIKSDYLMSS